MQMRCKMYLSLWPFSHEIWPWPCNTATPLIQPKFFYTLVTVLIVFHCQIIKTMTGLTVIVYGDLLLSNSSVFFMSPVISGPAGLRSVNNSSTTLNLISSLISMNKSCPPSSVVYSQTHNCSSSSLSVWLKRNKSAAVYTLHFSVFPIHCIKLFCSHRILIINVLWLQNQVLF